MKLLMTGGHVTPALACIDYIKKQKLPIEITFVGRKVAHKNDPNTTFEYNEIINRDIPFTHLEAGRFTRIASLPTLLHMAKIPVGFLQALSILQKEKPDAILSFGGYIALPIAIVASFLKIPVFTHEQTINPGLANKIIAKYSQKVFVSFPETISTFQKEKVQLTGNPIREEIFHINESASKKFAIKKDKPVIYITGGSLGAHSINIHIEKLLPELLKKYIVIHQCGNTAEYNDYLRLKTLKQGLSRDVYSRYHVFSHFSTEEIGYIYSITDLVISRSGANTFFELAALQKPTIFIPLPWSANGEQQRHAEIFQTYKVGQIFDQSGKSEDLLKLIEKMIINIEHYKHNFKEFSSLYVQEATKSIVETIYKV